MLSSSDGLAASLYLELAPSAPAPAQVDHLFVFRDTGALSGRGSGRFATDLFTLSVTCDGDSDEGPHVSLVRPRPDFVPRRSGFCGIVAGLRLSARPKELPESGAMEPLTAALGRVRQSDDGLPSLVAALDDLAWGLSFTARPQAVSDRTGRRWARADTGVSRRRLAATRQFRQLLGQFADPTLPLRDLALNAGYYDQSHMSSSCRAFAGRPPGALRSQATPRSFGLSLQDTRLKDRLRLVIMDNCKE